MNRSILLDLAYQVILSRPPGPSSQVLSELDSADQRRFLRFVTGCPRLPPGGIAALQPRLTVVRKPPSGTSAGDGPTSQGGPTPVGSFKVGGKGRRIMLRDGVWSDRIMLCMCDSASLSPEESFPHGSHTLHAPQDTSGMGTPAADGDLPSVMTCANYIKLPPYSSKEVMRQRLLYAIAEGQGSFDLS